MTSGFVFAASASASARMRRPSASVFSTSALLPFMNVMTSPGFCARSPGRFSVVGAYAVTATGRPSFATAAVAARTVAAPAMSYFIVSIDFAGLSESPPESNVMPLPTSATRFRAPAGA